ncbi:CIS tube protein [Cryptosporangium minutisporangium]|uniref:Contractile injection system tube protein N-terminal domain-containing protein n=1 Tax=Cryptosporangium minutisporangium TaxID=113569 RepID=A0ABP6SZM5_9ACTN
MVNLDPRLIAFGAQLERGALMRIGAPAASGSPAAGATAAPGDELTGDVLYFQYNPETISRTRTGKWEPRKKRKSGTVAAPADVRQRGGQGSSALLAEAETVALKVLFDATEAVLAGRTDAAEYGVLPQLAFLEVLSTGKEGQKGDARREAVQPVRPDELLLILGQRRLFPVVLTNLTITEQKFLPTLVPLRAEADLKFTVLEPDEAAYRAWISTAYDRLLAGRVSAAAKAAAQGDVAAAIARELAGDPFAPRPSAAEGVAI